MFSIQVIVVAVFIGIMVVPIATQFYEDQPEIPAPFPQYNSVPETSFKCNDRWGYYADPETGCQAFHLCQRVLKASFLCPNGTVFQQQHSQRCDHWFKVRCPP